MLDFSLVWTVFAAVLAWAAFTDITRLKIPNAAVVSLLALFVVVVVAAGFPAGWPWRLVVGLAALGLGVVLFALNVAGAGDGKLLAVVAMWAGPSHVVHVVALTAILGLGVLVLKLGVQMALTQLNLAVPATAHWTLPRSLVEAKAVPYGVAIAGAALLTSPQFADWIWVI